MENPKTNPSPSVEKIGITAGLLITVMLIIYFSVIKYLGMADVLELRLFNIVFVTIGVFYSIKKYKNSLTNGEDLYLNGWALGIYIVSVSTILFALFMSIYLSYFDTALLKFIQTSINLGEYINGPTIFLWLLTEGLTVGVIITFAVLQYFKRETEPSKESKGFFHKDKSGMESKI